MSDWDVGDDQYDYSLTPADIATQLEMLARELVPDSYHDGGSLSALSAEVFSLANLHPQLEDAYDGFARAIAGLHPQTYTKERWHTLQATASEVAAQIRALGI